MERNLEFLFADENWFGVYVLGSRYVNFEVGLVNADTNDPPSAMLAEKYAMEQILMFSFSSLVQG